MMRPEGRNNSENSDRNTFTSPIPSKWECKPHSLYIDKDAVPAKFSVHKDIYINCHNQIQSGGGDRLNMIINNSEQLRIARLQIYNNMYIDINYGNK